MNPQSKSHQDALTKVAVFKGKQIRKTIHNNEWWFVVEDVVTALIDSNDPKQYIQRMKYRDPELKQGWVQFVHTLLMETEGGQQKLAQLQNAPGFVPVIINIEPLEDLRTFLGLK